MPKVGEEEFDYTIEGMAEAEDYSKATGIPMSNAMDRVQNYQMGGLVGGQIPGRGQMPRPALGGGVPAVGSAGLRPPMGVPGYKKGGKVHKKGYKK